MSEVRILLGAPTRTRGYGQIAVAPCFFVRPFLPLLYRFGNFSGHKN
jgi:hypothetical protein